MKLIPISGKRGEDKFCIVDDEDYEKVSKYRWCLTTDGRPHTNAGKKGYFYLYHLILERKAGFVIDHANNDPLDNTRKNLRYATYSENNVNRESRRSNRFRGVYPNHDRWMAQIKSKKVFYYLGTSDTPEEAAKAYNESAKELHGEFARLNRL